MHYLLITSNVKKLEEFRDVLGLYGKRVEHYNSSPDVINHDEKRNLLQDENVIAVLYEHSGLYRSNEEEFILNSQSRKVHKLVDMDILYNHSCLTVLSKEGENSFLNKTYAHSIKGFIDLSQVNDNKDDVFGWDDVFIPVNQTISLHDMKLQKIKNSARQLVLNDFVLDTFFYDKRLDLNFNPQKLPSTVDFSGKVYDFVLKNELIKAGTNGHGLGNLVNSVLNGGIFFRSAINRREKNYWLPGLNAGIPLTAKKDAIHEITFFFHDLMHFLMPDLICDFNKDEDVQAYQDLYITYRIIGEAITLVIADMIFVDNLKNNGIEYDWSKRKIYPLYEQLNLEGNEVEKLRKLMYANALFACNNDDTEFRRLLKPTDEANLALEEYKEKYSRFFKEDIDWTYKNFHNMYCDIDYIKRWIDIAWHNKTPSSYGIDTLHSFKNKVLSRSKTLDVSSIFNCIFDELIVNNLMSLDGIVTPKKEKTISSAFRRYMFGQLSLFAKYGHVYDMPLVREKLSKRLHDPALFDRKEIKRVMELMNVYISSLEKKSIISHSEANTFKSFHPIFAAYYVFYDKKKDTKNMKSTSNKGSI